RQRSKQGYSLPIKNWLRGELRGYMEETFASSPLIKECFDSGFTRKLIDEHMNMKANHNHVLWAMVNLATWHRLFVEPPRRAAGAIAAAGVEEATPALLPG